MYIIDFALYWDPPHFAPKHPKRSFTKKPYNDQHQWKETKKGGEGGKYFFSRAFI